MLRFYTVHQILMSMFQSAMAITDVYDREAEKINTLRNLRKIHIDDEGKMVINDDMYAPILYHTADQRPRPQVPHNVQPPIIRDACARFSQPGENRNQCEQIKNDLVDSGNNSMTESTTDTGQLEEIPLCEDCHAEDRDNTINEDINKDEADFCNSQPGPDGQPGPDAVGIFGNMKRMLASFFETFDESDEDSATTEGT